MNDIRKTCSAARTLPLDLDEFNQVIETKSFTCGRSDLPLIKNNYARNFGHALACVQKMRLGNMKWETSDVQNDVGIVQV